MSKFKATKGKCELSEPFDGTILIGGNVKAIVLPYSIKGLQEEDKANAVLFSKAPEMLEALQDFINAKNEILKALDYANNMAEDYQYLFDNAEQLIKEATE
ncbi:hypothetical protein ATE49_15495 [Elizabethkingia miricola]|uniref:Uncharacterized protein n=1 Tax=Elizabethkingia miricola TaxID=172045 RepID=A0ABY3NAE3_ELIMR|nr:hypothetical protein [Elizabethkingia miricola]OBS12787.1 hypothetical protein ATE49_15495 [Elizabethkingia miricola]TYO83769.1 hypothetical protein LX74_04046 [Elizabethkingia miricola]